MTLTVCLEPGCPTLTNGGRCPEHRRPTPSRWESTTRARRLPSDWGSRRTRILRRDRYVCYVCGRPGADQVDHVIRGDNHDEANLAAIHAHPCHERKTRREGSEARRATRTHRQQDARP